MTLRIAVASEDGRFVQQHFGRARQFLICEIEGEDATVVEVRANTPACGTADLEDGGHGEDQMSRSVELVADCDAVIAARIGPSAVERLAARGVRAFIYPDTIERALSHAVDSGLLRTRPTGDAA
jgi:nitrogen fixation protein NifX